ncbi:MAG TPA: FliH/SctL family protein [Thermodesulfobacteriota bacterium]
MYSSKVFKNTDVRISAEPFCLSNQNEIPLAEVVEDVGSRGEVIEKEAYQRGFLAGEKAGFELGARKADVHFSGLDGLVRDIASFREDLFRACEKEMTALCLSIARKVVQREVAAKDDGILECLRTALRAVVAGGEITIRVNPKDFEVVNKGRPELLKYCGGVRGMAIEPDELVSRGGALISTNFGEIDATIESIMSEIEEKLADAYSRD